MQDLSKEISIRHCDVTLLCQLRVAQRETLSKPPIKCRLLFSVGNFYIDLSNQMSCIIVDTLCWHGGRGKKEQTRENVGRGHVLLQRKGRTSYRLSYYDRRTLLNNIITKYLFN